MSHVQAVFLYTKPGCHLCEQAEAILARLAAEFPHTLTQVDVSQDDTLFALYGERIPVIRIAQTELVAPMSEFRLRRALREGAYHYASLVADPPVVDLGSGARRGGERTE